MKFRYGARTKDGELQVGYIEAAGRDAASNMLSNHGLYILSLESGEEKKGFEALSAIFNRVKRKDTAIFTRQLSTMLEAKISLHDSLTALYYQTSNLVLREAVFEIATDIDSGLLLSQALEKHPRIFFEFYINLIRSAEVTGRIEEAMSILADFLEKELILRSRVKNALIYPVFVVSLAIVVGAILVALVFPQISDIFKEAEVDLPFITRLFLSLGFFLNDWWLAVLTFLAVLAFVVTDYLRSEEGKAVMDQVALDLPLLGGFFRKIYVARFAEVASVLIRGGIPIAQAIEIGGHTVGSAIYREVLHEIAEGVRRGELLSQSFGRYENYFPVIVGQMIAVGERTGKVDEVFVRIGNFYSREIEALVANMVELIQPILMVFIGIIVALLFASILFPIYSLIQVIQ